MNHFSKSLIAFAMTMASIAGCVCAESKPGNDVAQIIVKFKDANTEPATAAILKSLGETAKLTIRHVRPMSGGAQIYRLSGSSDDAALARAMTQISARPDVEYAEMDRKLQPQKENLNGKQP